MSVWIGGQAAGAVKGVARVGNACVSRAVPVALGAAQLRKLLVEAARTGQARDLDDRLTVADIWTVEA